jgi:hypothetical protein
MTNEERVDLIKKWVAALRSGEYKQGKGTLHNTTDNTYCCLGVLGRVWGLKQYKSAIEPRLCGYGSSATNFLDDEDFGKLAPKKSLAVQSDLARMNDSGKSFEAIADWIEENLL